MKDCSSEGKEIIHEISSCAADMTQAMDEVVWAVDARFDSVENLANFLNNLAQKQLALAGISYRLDAPDYLPDIQLSAEVRHNLMLAAKEALNNAIKHSGASELRLRVRIEGSLLTISIEDNGLGADDKRRNAGRNGLENMRRRLEEIGGRFDCGNREGGGFWVRLCVDLAGSSSPASRYLSKI